MPSRAVAAVTRAHSSLVFPRRLRVLVDALARILPREAQVLDVGSGDGQVAASLLRQRPDLRVEGVDVLVRPDTAIPVSRFDGRSLPFPDAAFDAVMLIDVLHHADDCEGLLREAGRVAASCVVIKDHDRSGFGANTTLRFMDWVGNRGHGVALPYHYLSGPEWERLFQRVGLEIDVMECRLGLYPPALSWIFDRSLHFLARLRRITETGG